MSAVAPLSSAVAVSGPVPAATRGRGGSDAFSQAFDDARRAGSGGTSLLDEGAAAPDQSVPAVPAAPAAPADSSPAVDWSALSAFAGMLQQSAAPTMSTTTPAAPASAPSTVSAAAPTAAGFDGAASTPVGPVTAGGRPATASAALAVEAASPFPGARQGPSGLAEASAPIAVPTTSTSTLGTAAVPVATPAASTAPAAPTTPETSASPAAPTTPAAPMAPEASASLAAAALPATPATGVGAPRMPIASASAAAPAASASTAPASPAPQVAPPQGAPASGRATAPTPDADQDPTLAPAVAVAVSVPVVQQTGDPARPARRAADPVGSVPAAAAPATPAPTTTVPAAPAVVAPSAAAPAAPPMNEQIAGPVLSLRANGDGEHVVVVRVNPENLGPVTVRAHVSGDAMRIELVAPSAASRDALGAMLPALHRDLAAAGATTSGVSVTSDDGAAWSGSPSSSDQGGSRGRGEPAPIRDAPQWTATAAAPVRPVPAAGSGRLDVLA